MMAFLCFFLFIMPFCSYKTVAMLKYTVFLFSLFVSRGLSAQQASYTDPASSYLRILLEKSGEGSYQQIGNFKVKGTSYLFGPKLNGDVYTPKEKALKTLVSYNTFNQQLEVFQNGAETPLLFATNEVDSFKLLATARSSFSEDLLFYNSLIIDPSAKKFFLQKVATGLRFSLYKSYRSVMGYVSTNYVQSELRQFDLNYEYYYTDSVKPGLKKFKTGSNNLKKEFLYVADVSSITDNEDSNANLEYELKKIFALLNNL